MQQRYYQIRHVYHIISHGRGWVGIKPFAEYTLTINIMSALMVEFIFISDLRCHCRERRVGRRSSFRRWNTFCLPQEKSKDSRNWKPTEVTTLRTRNWIPEFRSTGIMMNRDTITILRKSTNKSRSFSQMKVRKWNV